MLTPATTVTPATAATAACKHGAGCVRFGCTFAHPDTRKKDCKYGGSCTAAGCQFLHPKPSKKSCHHGGLCVRFGCTFAHPEYRKKDCKYGGSCTRAVCWFLHPKGHTASAGSTAGTQAGQGGALKNTKLSTQPHATAVRPHEHFCPITHAVMTDPVVAMDGQTYEREAIEHWFAVGGTTSPLTNEEIPTLLIPNHAVRSMIRDFAP